MPTSLPNLLPNSINFGDTEECHNKKWVLRISSDTA